MSSSSSSSKSSPPSFLKHKRKERDGTQNSDVEDAEDVEDDAQELEAPVLSHAERRRQEKRKKQEEKEQMDASPSKKRKLKDGTAIATGPATGITQRQNSIWVGNMSFKTTPDDLRTFFDGVGEFSRINMPMKAPTGPGLKPENRGFAYIDFTTPEGKTGAITKSEQPLLGRKLLIKNGDDFTGRPAPAAAEGITSGLKSTLSKSAKRILGVQKQPPAPTLFIGNLGFETTEESIRELLEAHRVLPRKKKVNDDSDEEDRKQTKAPWIRKVRMGTFEDSGLCKGFAFVDFMTTEDATSALINPKNHQLDGRSLKVEYAGAEAVRRGAPKSKAIETTESTRRQNALSAGHRLRSQDTKMTTRPETSNEGDDQAAPKPKWNKPEATHGVGNDGARRKGPRTRPKPGAALALAKRESAAIIPSQGQKITF